MTRRAFVAFSGGGARGVVHVGALKAFEERRIDIRGVSGTSAGAIIASLAAAGFRSDELIHSESGETVLTVLNQIDPRLKTAKDLFGRVGWVRVWLFRLCLKYPAFVFLPMAVIAIGGPPVLFVTIGASVERPLLWSVLAWAAVCIAVFWTARRSLGGMADLEGFKTALGELLRRRMFPDEPDRIVRMRDFGHHGRPSLKIVSANLSRGSLHLFSPERTPDTPVADAVAASVCLPVIFRPRMVDGDLHVDGGIVSNLPAWPFDEERELDPEALTIAVEIENKRASVALGRFNWLPAALTTALFGSSQLSLRVSGPAEELALPTSFGLLSFDRTGLEAAAEVNQISAVVGARLDKRLLRLPLIYQEACSVIQALTADALGITGGGKRRRAKIRVAIGKLERGYVDSLRLSHSVGFDDDCDELLLVPLEGSLAGRAWRQRATQWASYPLPPSHDLPGAPNRLRRKARWPDAKWLFCIPIFEAGSRDPRMIVHIDSNHMLEDLEAASEDLGTVEDAVREMFNLLLQELKVIEDDHGRQH